MPPTTLRLRRLIGFLSPHWPEKTCCFFPIYFSERLHKWERINDPGMLVSARLD